MNTNNNPLSTSSQRTGQTTYESTRDSLVNHTQQGSRSGQPTAASSTQFGRNDANTNSSNSSATTNPLGSLRDLINQKTGNTDTASHNSNRVSTQGYNSTNSQQQGHLSNPLSQPTSALKNDMGSRNTTMADRERGATILPGSTSGARNDIGSAGLGSANSRDVSGRSYDTTSAIGTTGMTDRTGMTSSTGMTDRTGTTNTTGISGAMGSTGMTDRTGTTGNSSMTRAMGSTGTTGVSSMNETNATTGTTGITDRAGTSGTTGITGTSDLSNLTSFNSQQQTSNLADQKARGSSNTAMGQGTGEGLIGTYDFLRTNDKSGGDSKLLDLSGPDHIVPPPGSREPPTSTSTSTSRRDNL